VIKTTARASQRSTLSKEAGPIIERHQGNGSDQDNYSKIGDQWYLQHCELQLINHNAADLSRQYLPAAPSNS